MWGSKKNSSWLFYVLIAYVLLAGLWWSYLLVIKNQDALEAKKQVLWYKMRAEGMRSEAAYYESEAYQTLVKDYRRQDYMILGEGLVLLGLILAGIGQIYRSRKKEAALALQQQNFLLSITHELKSPIAAIQLVLQTLRRRQWEAEQVDKLTGHALKDSQRLHRLVEDLLLAARVEGGYTYHFEPIYLQELLQDCAQPLKPLFKGSWVWDLPAEAAYVLGDRSTLHSVFRNLLDNAIKYAPDSPELRLSLQIQGKEALVEVIDQGPGLAKAYHKRIFEKFYRPGNEQTRQSKGTGLGLFIAKKVVEAHQGQISLRDNQPHGLIFSIRLPLTQPD